MDQSLSVVTLSTPDLDATRRFYGDGLGWTALVDVEDEIIFFQAAPGLVLGFFEATKFDQDLGRVGPGSGVGGVVLAHNVADREAVASVLRAFDDAGGTILTSAREGAFGGIFHGHAADPNGVVWEIAHNPGWRISDDGAVVFGSPE